MSDQITMRKFRESEGVEDLRVVGEGACAYFRTGSFAAGSRLAHAISELAGLDDHHPDVDLRHDGVIVRLITVAAGYYGLSERASNWLGRSRRSRASWASPAIRPTCRRSKSRSTRSTFPR